MDLTINNHKRKPKEHTNTTQHSLEFAFGEQGLGRAGSVSDSGPIDPPFHCLHRKAHFRSSL